MSWDKGEELKTMVFSFLGKESLAKCPLCQASVQRPISLCLHLNSMEKRQERVTCLYTDLEIETNRVKKKMRAGVLLGGLQTVNVNSTWESIIEMPVKDNAPQCILYSVARNVSECWSMYVWARPGGDCNCTRDPLKWPSAWGLTVLSNINPHPPYMPYFHIAPSWLSYGVTMWRLCLCASRFHEQKHKPWKKDPLGGLKISHMQLTKTIKF